MLFSKRLRENPARQNQMQHSYLDVPMSRWVAVTGWTRPYRRRFDCAVTLTDITDDLARESGFESMGDLLRIAKHGSGHHVYLIRFRYLPSGAWDTPGRKPRQTIGSS
jgi:hypothetical protein